MALKSKEVQRQYSSLLGKFLDFCKFEGLDIEQKAIKFCDFVKLKSQEEVEDLIIDLFYSKRKPQKDGTDKPLYDYQRIIFDVLVTQNGNANASNKHLWIKKATGLDVSEFMLRFMAWLCLKDNALAGSQMCIVTGPRIDLAIALIDRMKKLFSSSKSIAAAFNKKETM
jgi:late competence protein required for DNA uptake (superfamily II DNA/RNA helicase)